MKFTCSLSYYLSYQMAPSFYLLIHRLLIETAVLTIHVYTVAYGPKWPFKKTSFYVLFLMHTRFKDSRSHQV